MQYTNIRTRSTFIRSGCFQGLDSIYPYIYTQCRSTTDLSSKTTEYRCSQFSEQSIIRFRDMLCDAERIDIGAHSSHRSEIGNSVSKRVAFTDYIYMAIYESLITYCTIFGSTCEL